MKPLIRKRPCRVCRRWFQPSPRAGDRQHTCSAAECQRERHRRACQAWHEGERHGVAEARVQQRLRGRAETPETESTGGQDSATPPAARGPVRIRWEKLRDAVPAEVLAAFQLLQEVARDEARDAVRAEVAVLYRELAGLRRQVSRDGFARGGRPP